MIEESDGSLIHSQKRRLEPLVGHFSNRLFGLIKLRCTPMPGGETMQVDAARVRSGGRETGFLKNHGASGTDGLFLSFFKDGGNC